MSNQNPNPIELIQNIIAGIVFLCHLAFAIAYIAIAGFLAYVFFAIAIATWPS